MNPDALRTQTRPQLWKIEPIYRNHHHLFHLYNQTQLTEFCSSYLPSLSTH
ncbi:hypothetical protein HanXRQr2_Chr14g0668371 [Helianthus annuus]|uniref:Uncharacterized protein n=1 Tax=Helianthus annuus TaxID=4232 RepID=A0A9K3H861_HELAN|nr:hypothetical protein HanXRQr2_Chr14g0668361 [Helianthus annuus]KAF5771237.1 hypothetical protein HanXRQr2_Chr14g0668371 [Helianthus annuus]